MIWELLIGTAVIGGGGRQEAQAAAAVPMLDPDRAKLDPERARVTPASTYPRR